MLEIIVLSLVQALTEFLPVSSSGHLIIIPRLLGWGDQGLEMDVAVHVGTLLAVLLYFRRELGAMIHETVLFIIKGCKKTYWTPNVQLSFVIVVATLPAVIVGFALKKLCCVPRSSEVIAATAIGFGIVLWVADRCRAYKHSVNDVTFSSGLVIGLAQAIALIPGTSRSGICMTAARFLGFDRPAAAQFAFLLSIPTILGGAVLTAYDACKSGMTIDGAALSFAIAASFVFGLAAIKGMLYFIGRYTLTSFVIYRIILGIILLVWL